MGRTVHNERYEDIILRALPIKYENANRQLREVGLWARRNPAHGTHHVRRQPFPSFQREAGRKLRHCHAGGGAQR